MFNICDSVLEALIVYRIMDGGTSKTGVCNLNLILNCSAVFMENNCEFEWSSDNGGVLHKHDKSFQNREPRSLGAKIRKVTRFHRPLKLLQDNLKGKNVFEKYGELIVLGYNGSLPQGDRGRKRSRFELYKKHEPNGVKRSVHYAVKTTRSSKAVLDEMQHSITYMFGKNRAIIVEYVLDENTDMFQIGRSPEAPIDFVVLDTIPGNKSGDNKVLKCNISRFACRILADRSTKSCKIYAAGFDTSRNIFLGEKAPKWQENDDIDGMTTNGVLIMHPNGSFCSGEVRCGYEWWETSVTGKIFTQRELRSSQEKGQLLEDKTNILEDGTLIYLSGATLLWRSAEGLALSPNKHDLRQEIDKIITVGPPCLIGLKSLISDEIVGDDNQQPYVYLNCGHVEGVYDWEQKDESGATKCPFCLKIGPVVEACLGIETAFFVDCGFPTFAFSPCGHMATEKTVKYWASTAIPHGTNGYHAICPFCAVPLSGSPGYVQLILQDGAN